MSNIPEEFFKKLRDKAVVAVLGCIPQFKAVFDTPEVQFPQANSAEISCPQGSRHPRVLLSTGVFHTGHTPSTRAAQVFEGYPQGLWTTSFPAVAAACFPVRQEGTTPQNGVGPRRSELELRPGASPSTGRARLTHGHRRTDPRHGASHAATLPELRAQGDQLQRDAGRHNRHGHVQRRRAHLVDALAVLHRRSAGRLTGNAVDRAQAVRS